MKLFNKFFMCLCTCAFALGFASCGGDDDDSNGSGSGSGSGSQTGAITLTASSIKDGAEEVAYGECDLELTFSTNVTLSSSANITLNGTKVTPKRGTTARTLIVSLNLEPATNYTLNVPAGSIVSSTDANKTTDTFTIKFKTKTPAADEDPAAPAGMRATASGLVKKINVGWNLGNTGEATDEWTDDKGGSHWNNQYVEGGANLFTETSWQSAKTTKEMFTALKNAGFNAIRVPVRWYRHADKDLNINKEWMARVKEIVDYAISQDMYVVLNSHHDNWYDRLTTGYNETEIHNKFKNMWTQIANNFKDYDEHLIFAAANEIISVNGTSENWGNPNDSHYKFINNLMQLFVTTVRATGGNNEWRCLMVQPWACNPAFAVNSKFVLPTDTKKNRLIVEYHCYDPYNYAIGKGQAGNEWAQHEPQQSDLDNVVKSFASLNTKFVEKGIPCIMAEFGSTQDNSYDKGNDAADKIRADYHTFIVKEAKKYNIPGFYWDNFCFTTDGENFGLLDRATCTFPARAKIALDGIMNGLK